MFLSGIKANLLIATYKRDYNLFYRIMVETAILVNAMASSKRVGWVRVRLCFCFCFCGFVRRIGDLSALVGTRLQIIDLFCRSDSPYESHRTLALTLLQAIISSVIFATHKYLKVRS